MRISVLICQIAVCTGLRLIAHTQTHSQVPFVDTGPNAKHVDTQALCKRLINTDNQDLKECMQERSGDYIVNNYCLSLKGESNRITAKFASPMKLNIGIISVDDRADHIGHQAWKAYAKKHGYTYLMLKPDANLTDPMASDWSSTGVIKDLLQNPAYNHITHFMYVETDQWPVQPFGKLEPIFQEAGLAGPSATKLMAVVGEYPCDNVRDGGMFNMGNFLFVRHERMLNMFKDWYNSESNNPHDKNAYPYKNHQFFQRTGKPTWPGRQGAFHTGGLYKKYEAVIHRFNSGNPLGSPYGTMVGHVTGGFLEDTFDPDLGRPLQSVMVKCVQRRLKTDDHRPCSMYPKWVGGSCIQCRGSVKPDGTVVGYFTGGEQNYHYTGCCGEIDQAMPLETFVYEVKKGLHKPGVKVDLSRLAPMDSHPEYLLHRTQ